MLGAGGLLKLAGLTLFLFFLDLFVAKPWWIENWVWRWWRGVWGMFGSLRRHSVSDDKSQDGSMEQEGRILKSFVHLGIVCLSMVMACVFLVLWLLLSCLITEGGGGEMRMRMARFVCGGGLIGRSLVSG